MSKLVKQENQIIRILNQKDNQFFVVDCIKRTMPKWIQKEELVGFEDCTEVELYDITGVSKERILNGEEEKIARERFTMIAPILPFVADVTKRNYIIDELAKGVSKQTIRKYLCLYLCYQDISVLAPTQQLEKELSVDEKNMRWSLNKYYYTSHKNSLQTAYTLMLKEKYCDPQGNLLPSYPTFCQYRYYYRKNRDLRRYYISRDGKKSYERNNRPLLGDGVQEFAPNVGVGLLDATLCDIFLVDSSGAILGRPILTACVDAFSSLCCGYTLTLQGGNYSLKSLMLNIITDKQKWLEKVLQSWRNMPQK